MRYRFVDCRYELGKPHRGRELYREGHIPGASFLDLDHDLSDMSRAPSEGRHPLPNAEAFAVSAGRAGIGPGVFVVAYDQGRSGGAARLWWLLRHFGHEDVAVLDGGIGAWLGSLAVGDEEIEAEEFVPSERSDDTVSADELLERIQHPEVVVLDSRPLERYRGEVEPLDPVAGHIPGARNAPFTDPLPEELLRAGRAGRLLRLGGHGLRHPAGAAPGRPNRCTALPGLVERVVASRPSRRDRLAERADQHPTGDDQHGADHDVPTDQLAAPDEHGGEEDSEERFGSHERADDAHPTAVEGFEERGVGEAPEESGERERPQCEPGVSDCLPTPPDEQIRAPSRLRRPQWSS